MYIIRETEGVIIKSILDTNPGAVIKLKKDKRFKEGHIKVTGTELRGDVEYIKPFTSTTR
jgi:hypothetical protein